ncbi:MAG: DNA-directed RNA polymerase subunit beta, partial [Micrococcales bacterium]|nr:DNA-directed RNA polymerase subunit beta [Micrococcales bacterium]
EYTQAAVDTILRGLFRGDFAVALDRAAAFCRVQAAGATYLADDYNATESDRSAAFTTRALRLSDYASDLSACAALWRRESLT